MLWYKAWLETRLRFLLCLCGTLGLCSYFVFHGVQQALSYATAEWYRGVLHAGHSLLAFMWVIAVNLLMMGGLLREKAAGASAFTLALPVSRRRLMGVRAAVGLIEAMLLVLIPWAGMYLVDAVAGKAHSPQQAGFHLALLAGGGVLYVALALLVSSLIEGEYTAPLVSFGAVVALGVAMSEEPYQAYSPGSFIVGARYFDRHTSLLMGPIPWMHILSYALLAAVLTVVSVKAIERREF